MLRFAILLAAQVVIALALGLAAVRIETAELSSVYGPVIEALK